MIKKFKKSYRPNKEEIETSYVVDTSDSSLHNEIFKNNAFKVWEYLKEKLRLDNTSRSDVKFIYEEMKKDGFIHKTVNQTFFLDWINQTYDMVIQKTSYHSRTKLRLDRYQEALDLYNSRTDT